VSWVFLFLAILFEVCGTTAMKLSAGFSKLLPSAAIFFFYALSFWALTIAIKGIAISTAYAIWSGLGTAMIVAVGVLWFREPLTALKIVSIGIIIIGVVGLRLAEGAH